MNRGQISFAFAGLLFGSLVGFVVAHQLYAGRGLGFQHPPVPPGMEGAVPAGDRPGATGAAGAMQGAAPGGSPTGGAPQGGGGDMATMEQVQREIQALKGLLEKEPRNLTALTRLGDMYYDAGMFDKAKDYYARSLEVKPDDINVLTDLGTSLRNMGQPKEALKEFEAAVAAQPAHWRGWFNIGIVALYDLGDIDRAQQAFEKVAALNPGAIDMNALREEIARVRAGKAQGGAS